MQQTKRNKNEVEHFTHLQHIWWGAKTPAGQKRYDNKSDLFKKICKPKKNQIVLEVGCGDGEFTKRLISIDSEIIAIDITPKVVEKGRREIKAKNLKFTVDNAEKMKFKSGLFDIVCGVSIIHHMDQEKSVREMYRVLKKGGQLFFTEPNLLNPHIWAGLHIKWLRKRMEFSIDETALIRWDISRLLKSAGFREVKVLNYDFLHPITPKTLIVVAEKLSHTLERIPLVKEISGSLMVWARK